MPTSGADKEPTSSAGGFLGRALGFFTRVLDAAGKHPLLAVLWGVEVMLFLVLALMVLFGDMAAQQAFGLALAIVAAIVVTFLASTWRWRPLTASLAGDDAACDIAPGTRSREAEELHDQARYCLQLLEDIRVANDRVLRRGRADEGPWARIQGDTYNRVCRVCHQGRNNGFAADPYLQAICTDPDVATVCDAKWLLGEALEAYRRRLARLPSPPVAHEDAELAIRRAVTQPDCTPAELREAVTRSADQLRRLLEPSPDRSAAP